MEGMGRRKILVVEDEHGVAGVLRRRLEASGYEVRTEIFGKAALRYAAEHRSDLVILDLMLPDISGLEVSRELRKQYHRWDLPILMLTALVQPSDELRGFASGADAYLTKPYDHTDLLQTVALLLGEASSQESASAY